MDPVELAAQIEQTRAFIAARPITVVLTPHTREGDGSGGKKLVAGEPRAPQVMRLTDTASIRQRARSTEVGEQHVEESVLLAMPDAAIAPYDTFDAYGATWQVKELLFPLDYEIRATVVRYGR